MCFILVQDLIVPPASLKIPAPGNDIEKLLQEILLVIFLVSNWRTSRELRLLSGLPILSLSEVFTHASSQLGNLNPSSICSLTVRTQYCQSTQEHIDFVFSYLSS